MRATDSLTRICQVAKPDVSLPCDKLVGDFRCERLDHHEDKHWVGEHTSRHSIAGAQYDCDAIDKTASSSSPMGKKKIIGLTLAGVLLAVAAAFGVTYAERQSDRDSVAGFTAGGPIRAVNSTLHGFTGAEVESTNVDQKSLGTESGPTSPPAIVFSGGDEGLASQEVHLYMDFGDKESRDLITLNQSMLLALVEGGRISLHVHPVPSGDAFSIYAAEALAEAAYLSPDNAWAALVEILKTADVALAKELGPNKLADAIAEAGNDAGVEGMDRESIQNGTFVSWLLSIASDPKLVTGSKLPSLFVGDTNVELSTLNLINNAQFEAILGDPDA